MLTLSIIICTFNRRSLLTNCLDALVPQMPLFADKAEVIVVDNNSRDGTRELLSSYTARHPWLRYLQEPRQGLSNARNSAVAVAAGDYVCFLDDDARPSPGYLASLFHVIEAHQPDIFGGPIYPYYTTKKPWWFDDAFEIRRHSPRSGFADCRVSGGNFGIRARLLQELGCFSPNLGMIGTTIRLGEEREILEKYRRLVPATDRRIYYSLESFVYHHVPKRKMRLRYVIRRAYASGKSAVIVKREPSSHLPPLIRELVRTSCVGLPAALLHRHADAGSLVLSLQRLAILAGKISQHVENITRRKIHPHRRDTPGTEPSRSPSRSARGGSGAPG